MMLFSIYNLKGGVGKTTSAVNLAYLAAKEGYRTLLWDLDPQSAATFYINEKASSNGSLEELLRDEYEIEHLIQPSRYPNLSYIAGNLKNRTLDFGRFDSKVIKTHFQTIKTTLKERFDYVFIDCSPSLNLASERLFRASHFILLPIIPTPLSFRAYEQIRHFFEEHNFDLRRIVPFFTLVDHRRKLHRDTMETFRATQPKILNSIIPYASIIEQMGKHQAPVLEFAKGTKAAFAYRHLWQELKWLKKLKPLKFNPHHR